MALSLSLILWRQKKRETQGADWGLWELVRGREKKEGGGGMHNMR